MSGFAAARRDGLVAATLARVEDWLLEPADRGTPPEPATRPPVSVTPPVVAVVPLAPRCGGTTVARGLAATLAARGSLGAAVVCGASGNIALALATPSATRLGRAVGDFADEPHRVSGRLCLVDADPRIARAAALRNESALVIDVPHGTDASESAALADVTVLVAAADTEPSLAVFVGASLARSGPEPIIVVAPDRDRGSWNGRATLELPDARLASRLALAGREPPGTLGASLAYLADLCEEAAR